MKTFIIAEAGVNHNGDLRIAKRMIEVAKEAGADVVKFQTFIAEKTAVASAEKAGYQVANTGTRESQVEMLKALELSRESHRALIAYCRERGIRFMSSAFDLASIELLVEYGIEIWKIPSGEITNFPYLQRIGQLNREIIMSTGMATMDEVRDALRVLLRAGTSKGKITVLHCHTDYPTRVEDVNLRAMLTMRDELGVQVGLSDHTLGIEIPIAAVALGASLVEKHFTLDRNLPGPDHKASLLPEELKTMVVAIRNIEQALGDGVKRPTARELEMVSLARKSIVASCDIAAGSVFTPENITTKRPGGGISPMQWEAVLGRVARCDFKNDEYIEL